jgi:hypothetical protein
MSRPIFLNRVGLAGTHFRATPEPTPSAKGSTSGAYIAGAVLVVTFGAGAVAIVSGIREAWVMAAVSGFACPVLLGAYGIFARLDDRKRLVSERRDRERKSGRLILEAESRRLSIKAQIDAMHDNDPRRGRLQHELERSMFVVLGGGRP